MSRGIVALVGERDLGKRAHAGIEASFALFAQVGTACPSGPGLGVGTARRSGPGPDLVGTARRSGPSRPPSLTFRWVPTNSISVDSAPQEFSWASGIWCTPGSPYENTEGALAAIRFARTHGIPFLGTCGGFQHALMEYSQNVLGHTAAHQELDGDATQPLIARLSCSLVEKQAKVLAEEGSWYAEIVGTTESTEEFHCNYGLSPAFEPIFAGSKLEFMARDEQGQVRAFRLADHAFFMGTLFQPERKALTGALHPLVYQFLCKSVEPVPAQQLKDEENVQP